MLLIGPEITGNVWRGPMCQYSNYLVLKVGFRFGASLVGTQLCGLIVVLGMITWHGLAPYVCH